jgi:YD repeat-containing protein
MLRLNFLKYALCAACLGLAACLPTDEVVETANLIIKAEMFNGKGDRIASSEFSYDGRARLITESHYNGVVTTKTVLEYDAQGRLKTRTDDALGLHPVKLDYTYADDGSTVNVKQSSDDQPTREMNNLLKNGVLVGRNWGEAGRNTLTFKIERKGKTLVRSAFTGGPDARTTETLSFDDAGHLVGIETAAGNKKESRRYDYDGAKLVKETVIDEGKTTATVVYSYGACKVFKPYADAHNYLHLDNLLAEVGEKKAK